jgi:hypothetical protein
MKVESGESRETDMKRERKDTDKDKTADCEHCDERQRRRSDGQSHGGDAGRSTGAKVHDEGDRDSESLSAARCY